MFFIIINFIFIFILLFLGQCNAKMIVLPIRKTIQNNNNNDDISKYFFSRELYTEIIIGTPPQILSISINTDNHIFYLSSNVCYDNSPPFSYNYSNSTTFNFIAYGFEEESDEFGDGIYASDYFSFYNSTDLKTNITKNDFEFYYTPYKHSNKNAKICGAIGLGLKQTFIDYNIDTFFNALKNKGLIDKYFWTYIYFVKRNNKIINFPEINNKYIIDNFDGILIFGNFTEPNEKNDENNNFESTRAAERDKNLKWDIIFDRIYSNDKNLNSIDSDIHADLSINYDYIVSPKEYFEKLILPFFNSYIDNKICQFSEIKQNVYIYEVIYCDKNSFYIQDISRFPSLFFYHHDFNYTFELTFKDLFEEINNNYYFLIVKNAGHFNEDLWKMGRVFLKKYQFSFDQDSKMIYFYPNMNNNNYKKNEEEKNNKENTKFNTSYIWIAICIICLIVGIFIGTRMIIRIEKKEQMN
jgi:hypothetical protein